jgi:hypothetical protein
LDCPPVCGNGVPEGNEQCDGGMGCTAMCTIMMTPEQQHCLDKFVTNNDPCQTCMCLNCTQTVLDCRDSGTAARDMSCSTIIECANKNTCVGSTCYCGAGYDPNNPLTCAFPAGPCVDQINAAANSTDPNVVTTMSMDTTTAVGRALVASQCGAEKCPKDCAVK